MTFMYLWATIAMGHAIALAYGTDGWGPTVLLGTAWATLLTILDRIICGLPLMSDSFSYRFFKVFLIRGFLAVFGSIVTAIAALLVLFGSSVDHQLAVDRPFTVATIQSGVNDSSDVKKAQAAIEEDKKQLQLLADAVTNAHTKTVQDSASYACEAAGTCGTRHADDFGHIGPATALLGQTVTNDNQAEQTAIATQASQSDILNKDVDTQNQLIANAQAKANIAIATANGLQERMSAFLEILRSNWTIWPWALLIFGVELSVPLLKTTLPASRVDEFHREQAGKRAAVAAEFKNSEDYKLVLAKAVANKAALSMAEDEFDHRKQLATLAVKQHRAAAKANRSSGLAEEQRQDKTKLYTVGKTVATIVGLLALGAGVWGYTQTQSAAAPTSQTAPIAIPAQASAYTMSPASPNDAAVTTAFLTTSGQPIVVMHRAVATMLKSYDANSCTAAVQAVQNPSLLVDAANSTPDEVVGELALDELRTIVSMSTCDMSPSSNSVTELAGVDMLMSERFTQIGITS